MSLMSLGGVECCEIHVQSERDNVNKNVQQQNDRMCIK
jgi:hypothetical protein